jgi:hypothetical protein
MVRISCHRVGPCATGARPAFQLAFRLETPPRNGYATGLWSSTPKHQVPSPDYWKGKFWQDFDFTESLWYYTKSNYPEAIIELSPRRPGM